MEAIIYSRDVSADCTCLCRNVDSHPAYKAIVSLVNVDTCGGLMTGFWLLSYIVLWLLVIVGGLIIIALAREIEVLHKHVNSLLPYLSKMEPDSDPSTG